MDEDSSLDQSLACFIDYALLFFNTAQGHWLSNDTIYSGCGLPVSVNKQDNAPTNMLTGQSDLGNSSVEVSSLQVTVGCVK